MIAGSVLVLAVMALLLFTPTLLGLTSLLSPFSCSSCAEASILELFIAIALFFVGAVVFAYGFTGREVSNGSPKTGRVISTAVLFSLASMMLYFWLNLFVNGL